MKKGQTVVYGQSICRIVDVLPEYRDGRDYYQLEGKYDTSLVIHAPVELANMTMRPIMSRDEAEEILASFPTYETMEADGKTIRIVCEDHLKNGRPRDVIRALRAHKLEKKNGYKWNEGDRQVLRLAEKILCRELGAALGTTSSAVRNSIYDSLGAATAQTP